MARQEEGWPLGLQPVNVRIGLGRIVGEGRDHLGSMSFNTTILTGSPTSSTDSSSDLDTGSTGSFFHDRSITLGSLIGVSSILDLSRRSVRAAAQRRQPAEPLKPKKNDNPHKSKTWMIFSLCSKEDSTDVKDYSSNNNVNPPSLGHFLAVERGAAGNHLRRHHGYGPADEVSLAQHLDGSNSLFVDGRVAPPRASVSSGSGVIEEKEGARRGVTN